MPDTLSVSRDFADIDPQYMGIFAIAGQHGVRPADPLSMPVDEARRAAQSYHAIWTLKPPPLAHVHETTFPGPAGPVRLRLYVPEPQAAERARPPVMIYFHGGGFVLNGLETHDGLMRLIAAEAGIAVCAVSYSLAPEHRFPTQLLEAVAAIGWLRENADDMGVDASRIAVGGDSAGANLALSATLALRDEGRSPVAMAVLSYGMFAADFDTPSHHRFGGGQYGLTTERMRWYWQQYLGQQGDPADPRAAPLLADLRGLPPVMLIAAGADCLLDDSIRLADRLTEADVPNRLSIHSGVLHSFLQLAGHLDAADHAIGEIATGLREVLLAPHWPQRQPKRRQAQGRVPVFVR
jgi:acetyl esterase